MKETLEEEREAVIKDLIACSSYELIRYYQGGIKFLDKLLKIYNED